MAKTKNDTARNEAEAIMPDSNGNLEMTPLRETDRCSFARIKEELTVCLVAEPCR